MGTKLSQVNSSTKRVEAGFIGQRMVIIPSYVESLIKHNPLIQSLYITDIGFFPSARYHYRERTKGAKEYILIYCVEGSGVIEMDDERIELTSNSYFIIPPDTGHRYSAVKEKPWSIYWLHFTGQQALNIYQKFCEKQKPKAIQVPFDESRLTIFDNMMDTLEMGYSADNVEYINLCLWQLLSSFVYHKFSISKGGSHDCENIIDTSIKYMRDNIGKVVSVNELAEQFNYSTSHYLRLFKLKTGYAPIHYFNNMKVQKACQYLSFSDMSVKQISFELGFDDPLYFSRVFKKAMGMPPLKYRHIYH